MLDNVMHLAQSTQDHMYLADEINLDMNKTKTEAPTIKLQLTSDMKNVLRVIGAVIGVLWGSFIVWKNAQPGSNGQGGGGGIFQKVGGFKTVIIAFLCIACIIDPENLIVMVNLLIKVAFMLISLLKSAFV